MTQVVHFHLTGKDAVGRFLKQMTVRHSGIVARAMNRTLLDVREAEARMTARAFDFWSAVTKNFMANEKSFPFDPATGSRLVAHLYAGGGGGGKKSGKLRTIFWGQEFGFTLNPPDRERLVLGKSNPLYAVPSKDPGAHLRTPRATVRSNQTPGALLRDSKGNFQKYRARRRKKKGQGNLSTHVFISPNERAILQREPGGARRVLYGLYDKPIHVDEHLEFFSTAQRVIGAVMLPKLLQEWDRGVGRFGA